MTYFKIVKCQTRGFKIISSNFIRSVSVEPGASGVFWSLSLCNKKKKLAYHPSLSTYTVCLFQGKITLFLILYSQMCWNGINQENSLAETESALFRKHLLFFPKTNFRINCFKIKVRPNNEFCLNIFCHLKGCTIKCDIFIVYVIYWKD